MSGVSVSVCDLNRWLVGQYGSSCGSGEVRGEVRVLGDGGVGA